MSKSPDLPLLAVSASLAEVFKARVEARADLVRWYYLDLPDAVDGLQQAANDYGLVDQFGQDWVQAMMATAFAEPTADAENSAKRTTRGYQNPASLDERVHAAGSTVDALMFSLRERGAAALSERDCLARLAALSSDQIRSVIARLIALKPRYPRIDDELLSELETEL